MLSLKAAMAEQLQATIGSLEALNAMYKQQAEEANAKLLNQGATLTQASAAMKVREQGGVSRQRHDHGYLAAAAAATAAAAAAAAIVAAVVHQAQGADGRRPRAAAARVGRA